MEFKRGDSFILTAAATDESDVAQSITGWTIRCQIRDKRDNLISEAVVTVTNAAGGLYKMVVSDTTDWPLETLYADIEYTTDAGQIVSTADFTIEVLKDRTLPVVV